MAVAPHLPSLRVCSTGSSRYQSCRLSENVPPMCHREEAIRRFLGVNDFLLPRVGIGGCSVHRYTTAALLLIALLLQPRGIATRPPCTGYFALACCFQHVAEKTLWAQCMSNMPPYFGSLVKCAPSEMISRPGFRQGLIRGNKAFFQNFRWTKSRRRGYLLDSLDLLDLLDLLCPFKVLEPHTQS